MELPKWHERPEISEKKIKDQSILDGKNFLKLADHFITFANTQNKTKRGMCAQQNKLPCKPEFNTTRFLKVTPIPETTNKLQKPAC